MSASAVRHMIVRRYTSFRCERDFADALDLCSRWVSGFSTTAAYLFWGTTTRTTVPTWTDDVSGAQTLQMITGQSVDVVSGSQASDLCK